MIPLPQILAELVMALGGALLAANAWVLLRPRLKPGAQPPARRPRAVVNGLIGLVVLAWGAGSFFAR
ncbi:MAG: hypothetical protein HY775_03510 [Acidobacteria bacterium]|nr:hypothetical protein [Acidobacteriota bacterium]